MAFARHAGELHDYVVLEEACGYKSDITVIGPESPNDTISLAAHGGGIYTSFALDRAQALRLGQMLVEAAGEMESAS